MMPGHWPTKQPSSDHSISFTYLALSLTTQTPQWLADDFFLSTDRAVADSDPGIVALARLAGGPAGARAPDAEDFFAEMCPFMVDVQHVDDSREAIYSPVEGE